MYVDTQGTIEYDKKSSLFRFNGKMNILEYCEIRIEDEGISNIVKNLILGEELQKLYKMWQHGSHIYLKLGNKTWKVLVEWVGERCTLGKGLLEFATETELRAGDVLVLYNDSLSFNVVNVCIFNGLETKLINGQGAAKCKSHFLKIVKDETIDSHYLVVPKLVKDGYVGELGRLDNLFVDGFTFMIRYDSDDRAIIGLDDMVDFYKVRKYEIIVFLLNSNNVLKGRIYQVNIMEADYYWRPVNNRKYPIYPMTEPFWDFENVMGNGISCISEEESSRISLGMCSPLREEKNGQITAKKRSKPGNFPVGSCAPAQQC
ncbi:hypothetical protein AgCh_001089 [Apium graveolens]